MTNVDPNLRKAAVLLRSLDADTAAVMLGQLSAEEAATLRAAMRAIGQVDTGEQADVVAELRGARPVKHNTNVAGDVELALSSSFASDARDGPVTTPSAIEGSVATSKRFEFLESAPIHALVPHLAREHAQTIAVVLSHLAPQRAAEVLAALPKKAQAATIERLSTLGETDPDCVTVLERELAAWAAKRDSSRATDGRRRDTMHAILAAADAKSRSQILSSMKAHSARGAAGHPVAGSPACQIRALYRQTEMSHAAKETEVRQTRTSTPPKDAGNRQTRMSTSRFSFDDLIRVDSRTLSSILRQVDANVLALALAGSREELVDRICDQMPKRTARGFRRELRRLGPTRLSDVEAAQHAVAQIAAQQVAKLRPGLATSRT